MNKRDLIGLGVGVVLGGTGAGVPVDQIHRSTIAAQQMAFNLLGRELDNAVTSREAETLRIDDLRERLESCRIR